MLAQSNVFQLDANLKDSWAENMVDTLNSLNALATIQTTEKAFHCYSLQALQNKYDIERLPYCHKVLLENLLRNEDGINVTLRDIIALATWDPQQEPDTEIAFKPARVLMQDFTGVPAIVRSEEHTSELQSRLHLVCRL